MTAMVEDPDKGDNESQVMLNYLSFFLKFFEILHEFYSFLSTSAPIFIFQ